MKLIVGLNEQLTAESTATIISGKWNEIYLSFALTVGGWGVQRWYLNGAQGSPQSNVQDAPAHSDFRVTDTITIGGAFKGQLRRVQIYSPGTFGITTGASNFSFIQ